MKTLTRKQVLDLIGESFKTSACDCTGTRSHCCSTYSNADVSNNGITFECSKQSGYSGDCYSDGYEEVLECIDGEFKLSVNKTCANDGLVCAGVCPPEHEDVLSILLKARNTSEEDVKIFKEYIEKKFCEHLDGIKNPVDKYLYLVEVNRAVSLTKGDKK